MVATDRHTGDRRGRPSTSSTLIGESTLLSPEKNSSDSTAFRLPTKGYELETVKSSTKSTYSATFKSPTKSGGPKDVGLFPTARRTSIASRHSRTSEDKRLSGATLALGEDDNDDHQLDVGVMLDALPGLVSASEGVLAKYAPPAPVPIEKLQKLIKDNTKFSEIINQQEKKFEREKKHFGSEHFIRVEKVVEGLPPASGLHEFIWHKANLARLALDVMKWLVGSVADTESCLRRLDKWFPSFLTPLSDEESEYSALQETLLAGLEIRTQYSMACILNALDDGHGKSPGDILNDIFIWPSLSEEFRGWNTDSLRDEDGQLPEQYKAVVADRKAVILRVFEGNGTDSVDVVIDRMEEKFPAAEFFARLIKWIRSETDKIDAQLKSLESVDVVVARLKGGLERPSSPSIELEPVEHLERERSVQAVNTSRESSEKEQLPESERTSPGRRIFGSKMLSRRLAKKLRKSLSGQITASQQEQEQDARDSVAEENTILQQDRNMHNRAAEETVPSSKAGSQELGDPNERSLNPNDVLDGLHGQGPRTKVKGSRSTSRPVSDKQRDMESKAKDKSAAARPRSFLNRQDGARATSPISETVVEKRTSRKRGASERDGDSESPAFEEDRRQVNVTRNRERAAKRARVQHHDYSDDYQPPALNEDDDLEAFNRFEGPPAVRAPVRRRRRAFPRVLGPTDNVIDIDADEENGGASPSSLSHNFAPIRKARARWTEEEDDRLIKWIGKYGTQYSEIEKADKKQLVPKLGNRSQNDLRYRARNIVMNYYKMGRPLPRNFEYVRLPKGQMEQLRELGIEPAETH